LNDSKTATRRPRVPVIGLLGGVASGKSLVAGQLAAQGAVVLDADRVGHEVLKEAQVKQALVNRWGQRMLNPEGEIDRSAVGRIVFAAPPQGEAELKYLESVVHPRIGRRLREQIVQAEAAGAPAIVLDAAVMLKAGWDRECDVIWFVDVPREVRAARARQRGWDEKQFAAREAAQESVEEKRRRSQAVIDNSGTPASTAEQAQELWRRLISVESVAR
jgi:dephospho-CoA kinase